MIVALEGRRFATVALAGEVKKYPLASRWGIAMFVQLVEAGTLWSRCTRLQQRLLVEWCTPLLEAVHAGGVLDAPAVPDGVAARTLASLRAKGVVDDDGHLSSCGVLAAVHGPNLNSPTRAAS